MVRASFGPVRPAETRALPSTGEVLCRTKISADSALSGAGGRGLQHDAGTVAERCGHFDTDAEESHTGCAGIVVLFYGKRVWFLGGRGVVSCTTYIVVSRIRYM